MDSRTMLLLRECFGYYGSYHFKMSEAEQAEVEAQLTEEHVDALLHFAHRIHTRIEGRGLTAGRVQ